MPSNISGAEPPRKPFYGRIASDQLIHKGDRVDLVLRTVTTNSGKTVTREVCLHRGAVIILPIAPDGRIVLIRNRRHTVFDTLLELPAGTLEYAAETGEPGDVTEDPALAAARELTEETGYTAGKIVSFGWFYTSPGILTEKMYAYVATDLTPGRQDLEDNEQIQVQLATRDEVLRLIQENRIVDAKSIATLLKYLVGSGGADRS
ncbi:MAG TPA: NUDIX hydrolase [Phycisphaerae bacterium]|nr:NUDIX hydrolase [Phycisphaerae bacterium]